MDLDFKAFSFFKAFDFKAFSAMSSGRYVVIFNTFHSNIIARLFSNVDELCFVRAILSGLFILKSFQVVVQKFVIILVINSNDSIVTDFAMS